MAHHGTNLVREGKKIFAGPTDRNKGPILALLSKYLPILQREQPVKFLELASGTGQHTVHFAGNLQNVVWQPSDPDRPSRESIQAYASDSGLSNVLPVLDIGLPYDHAASLGVFDAVLNVNMVHIAPWSACEGLWQLAGHVVRPGGMVFMYGPFRMDGKMVKSNEEFDQSLRGRNSEWGIRNVEDIASLAAAAGFKYGGAEDMPANNKVLVFTKEETSY